MHRKINLENIFDERIMNILINSKVLLIEMNRDIENIDILYNIAYCKSDYRIDDNDIVIIDSPDLAILKDAVSKFKKELMSSSLNGSNRFGIINGIENMNVNSANSLLKSIEEPNNNVFFVFGTSNLNSILETIRSRCTIISIKKNIIGEEYEKLKKSSVLSNFEEISIIALKFIDSLESPHKIIFLRRDQLDGFSRQEMELFLDLLIYEIHIQNENVNNSQKILSVLIFERERFNKNLNIGLFLDNLTYKVVNCE